MTEFGVTFRIEKVGDKEALQSLNLLDQKGREVVESIAGRTGKALGDVASAYTRSNAQTKKALEEVAASYDRLAKEEAKAASEAERAGRAQVAAAGRAESAVDSLARRQSMATLTAARGAEQIARTAQTIGSGLDTVISQVSQLAFGFGATGPIVGAIAITSIAIVDLFRKATDETKKLIAETAQEYTKIARMSVTQQGERAALLFNGDPTATLDKDGNVDLARFSVANLRQQQAQFRSRLSGLSDYSADATGMVTASGKVTDALKRVNAELERRNKLLGSITGPTGSMQAAGSLEAKLGMLDARNEQDEKSRQVSKQAIAASARQYVQLLKERQDMVRRMAAELSNDDDPTLSPLERISRYDKKQFAGARGGGILAGVLPSKSEIDAAVKAASSNVSDAIKNDPFLNAKAQFDEHVDDLAKHMHEALNRALGEGLIAGFESAFSGEGISAAFGALTATVLNGLGDFLQKLGAAQITTGTWLKAFAEAVTRLDGYAAIAAGVGLIAAGSAMKAVASSFGGGSSGGGGGGSYSSRFSGSIIDRGSISPANYSAANAGDIVPRPNITFAPTIIGPNDPGVLRGMDEILRKLGQTGSLSGVAWSR